MAEKKQGKRIRFESWKYPHRTEQGQEILAGMMKMGSPIASREGALARLVYDQLGIRAEPLSKDGLLAEINLTTDFLVQKWEKAVDSEGKQITNQYGEPVRKLGTEIGDVHHRVINHIYGMSWPQNGLWNLRGVLSHPVINQRGEYVIRNGLYWRERDVNGTMVRIPEINLADGYDGVSQCFYAVPDRVRAALAGIETLKPADADVIAALECIDDFFCDFTFATKSAKASAVAFMLTMLCRSVMGKIVPMLEIRAPQTQSGKTKLASMMLWAVTGEHPDMFSPTFRNNEEFEKELFTHLFEGRNYIFMDNVKGTVESAFLDMALTGGQVRKRLLAMNKSATVYAGMPFVMTANNPKLSEDIKNRIYLLDILKPPAGKKFVHDDPEEYAREAGPGMVRSLFVLYNHWDQNCGRKLYKERRIEGYIPWSERAGGMLQAAGIEGFLDDTLKQINEIDPKLEQAADMAQAWYEAYGGDGKTAKEILAFTVKAGYAKEDDTEPSKIQKSAAQLERLRMVKLPGGYHFERNEDGSRHTLWRVVKDGSGS